MSIVESALRYRTDFLKRYGYRLSADHWHALSAMTRCRTAHYGQLSWRCGDCDEVRHLYRSCGHRGCPRCQTQDNEQWLLRQQKKLLPVEYFMVTFTLPAELRAVAWQHQKVVYELLLSSAVTTCRDFAVNDKALNGEIGLSAVLHSQTRRLDYHPHVHLVIPAGAVDKKRRLWRVKSGGFLFSHKALATVFRAKMLKGLSAAGLLPARKLPASWVVDCRSIGSGLPALQYLSKYLYRGVIAEKQLVSDDCQRVTFSYREGGTGRPLTRTVDGADFVWLLIQHTLPKGFRRVRDYGFLHGNAKRTRLLVQWCLKVVIPAHQTVNKKPGVTCRSCGTSMLCQGFTALPIKFGYG